MNVAVASEIADGVELCVFGHDGDETRRLLAEYDAGVWHGFVPGMRPGDRYGLRVHGPYDPAHGLRCNPAKLLMDPNARALDGDVAWDQRIFGYRFGAGPDDPAGRDDSDSAAAMPRCVVVDPAFDWGDDRPPGTSYTDTLLYEVHVKGFTATHPDVPPELRGTYAGFAHPAAVAHLRRLGVTAVELLPVHQSVTNGALRDRGLVNYWGYDTVGFFAPHAGYSAAVRQGTPAARSPSSRRWSRPCTPPGIEVVLDVVFNHTAEGNQFGPTLCHRGLDNPAYYRLVDGDPAHYYDSTGTGNSLNVAHPTCLRMILDSLRYWVTEMHVDGFRFDLAATLGRQMGGFASTAGVLRAGRPGPGAVPGQAHRGAVGREPGRQLRPRPLPRPVVGVERAVPRHRARLLAQQGRHTRRSRHPGERLRRPVRRHPSRAPRRRSTS